MNFKVSWDSPATVNTTARFWVDRTTMEAAMSEAIDLLRNGRFNVMVHPTEMTPAQRFRKPRRSK